MATSPDNTRMKIAFLVIAVFMISGLVFCVYSMNFSPDSKRAHAFLREMPADKISEIDIEPYAIDSLVSNRIIIRDRQRINEIADVFRNIPHFSAEHPFSTWVCRIRFKTDGKDFGGQVESTKNGQGVIFHFSSEPEGGWNYGTYRQDKIGPILERIASEGIR